MTPQKGWGMSPPRDVPVDASKLSFPLQLVIMIASALAAVWASQYGLRSDVRDILTRMELQAQIVERDNKLIQKDTQTLNDRVAAVEALTKTHIAEYKLEGYDYKTLEARILALERRR